MNNKKIDCALIKEVFKTMKYPEKVDSGDMDEFVKRESLEEKKMVLSSISKSDKWSEMSNEYRANSMGKLASEIEIAVDSFSELQKSIDDVSTVFLKEKELPYLVETLKYYSNLCQLVKIEQKGLVICKVGRSSNLAVLGYALGPALAAGFKVLFACASGMRRFIEFIITLSLKADFPKETISVISDTISCFTEIYKHASVINVFDTIDNQDCDKMLGIIPHTTPFLIFDSADLDSACESVINSTWKNQLLFNCLAKEVFVQETIYEEFISKLKEKMDSQSFPLSDKVKKDASLQGITNDEDTYVSQNGHVLIFGERITTLWSGCVPMVSISAFRNVDEAIALGNNNYQGFATSVWTENIGIGNYVAERIDVANVWINSFGIYSPEISFSPQKSSGKGYFGGLQGFHELLFYNKDIMSFTGNKLSYEKKDLEGAISSAKTAHQKWKSLPKYLKIKQFGVLIKFINKNKNKWLKNEDVSEEWVDEWKSLFHQYIESNPYPSISSPNKNYSLNVSYSPKGVLVAEFTRYISNHNKRLLIASILQGNSLIVLNQYEKLQHFYNEISKLLPAGVLTVLPYSYGASSEIVKNRMVDCYFNEYKIDDDTLGITHKFMSVSNCWSDVYNKIVNVKNIWSNVGHGYLV